MSLDVHLSPEGSSECEFCGGTGRVLLPDVFWANITHNLNVMAEEAGIYEACWRPEEIPVKYAHELIPLLESGIEKMKADPARFEALNAKNGWGTYDVFLPWVQRYLRACKENPDALVKASR